MVSRVQRTRKSISRTNKPATSKVGRSRPPANSHVYKLIGKHINLTASNKVSIRRTDGFRIAYNATYTLFDETDRKELVKSGTLGDGELNYIDMLEGRKNVIVVLQVGETGTVKKSTQKGIRYWMLVQ